jgi:fatty-acyl-CoA synthase
MAASIAARSGAGAALRRDRAGSLAMLALTAGYNVDELERFERGLHKNAANYAPLTPLGFLDRAAVAYAERTAVIHGDQRFDYREFRRRCLRLGSALAARGVAPGQVVSVLAPNVPCALEAHYGVPMIGAILHAINTRLDAPAIAYMLDHARARVLIVDRELYSLAQQALTQSRVRPLLICAEDPAVQGAGETSGDLSYEALLAEGDPEFAWQPPDDEWRAITLNYTSGTTGHPKGVVYHHRGAYLLAMGNVVSAGLLGNPVYLWTVPMFHCNGWCFTWGLSVVGGTHVCLRQVTAAGILDAIERHAVTHLCGAPTVLNMIVQEVRAKRLTLARRVDVLTGGAPPPSAIIAAMEDAGFRVTHVYGLTETYGPSVVGPWDAAWDALPLEERAQRKARQGVRHQTLEHLSVCDPETLQPVPHDGVSAGEVMFRGNIVMKGYLDDPAATEKAFQGGLFHSGDLGVVHPDGTLQITDRSKDIIISGGENVSSVEVESVLYRHPHVLEAAVVARPDALWGETPCAFVALKRGAPALPAQDIIEFCRQHLAHFKCPTSVVFSELPKTATGKVQKFVLRERLASTRPRP